ncbi:hypothetical protein Tco_1292264 [Tanacetum coccineum]
MHRWLDGEEENHALYNRSSHSSFRIPSNSWQYCIRLKDKQLAATLALKYVSGIDVLTMRHCHLLESDPSKNEVVLRRQALMRNSHILTMDEHYNSWQEDKGMEERNGKGRDRDRERERDRDRGADMDMDRVREKGNMDVKVRKKWRIKSKIKFSINLIVVVAERTGNERNREKSRNRETKDIDREKSRET